MSLRRCIGQVFYKTFFIKPLLRNLFTKPFPRNLSHETFSTKPLCTELFCAELFCTKPSLEFPDTGVIRNFYYETIFGASVYRNYTKLLLRNPVSTKPSLRNFYYDFSKVVSQDTSIFTKPKKVLIVCPGEEPF